MLILISDLINRPVITFDEAEPLGLIRDPIIDPSNGKVLGYFFGHGLMYLKQAILSSADVVAYDQNRVVVSRGDIVRQVEEEPKIKNILDNKIPVLGAKVITENGTYLGRANDLLLDTEMSLIVRYYVHGVIRDRIVAAEHVIRIEKRGIIVDDVARSLGTAPAEAS